MDSLTEAVDGLVLLARSGAANAAVQAQLGVLAGAVVAAPPEEREAASEALGRVVGHDPSFRVASVAALAGGAIVELGAPPEPLAPFVLGRLADVLEGALRFTDALGARPDPEGVPEDLDPRLLQAARIREQLREDPTGGEAYLHLRHWCLPAITLLSLSPLVLGLLGPELATVTGPLGARDEHVRFLDALVRVPGDTALVVLHPASGRGWKVRYAGAADVRQLHTLLRGALADGGFDAPGPSPRALATATGAGPQDAGEDTAGRWGLYDGRALACAAGEAPPDDLRLWGSDHPAGIPEVAGARVLVLAGPPEEERWRAIRVFRHLRAYARVEEELSADTVAAWHRRLGSSAD